MNNVFTVIHITTPTTHNKTDYNRMSILVTPDQRNGLDQLAARLSLAGGGVPVSRAAAARICIDRGLSLLGAAPDGV